MEDSRYLSRKWKIAVWGLAMYTAVHIGNVWTIILAAYLELLPESALESLWAGSVTVWSVGVGAILAIYMGGNVADTFANGEK